MQSGELNIKSNEIDKLVRLFRENQENEAQITRGSMLTCGINAFKIVEFIAKKEGIRIGTIKRGEVITVAVSSRGEVFGYSGVKEDEIWFINEPKFEQYIKGVESLPKFEDKNSPIFRGIRYLYNIKEDRNDVSHTFEAYLFKNNQPRTILNYKELEKWFFDVYLEGKFNNEVKLVEDEILDKINAEKDKINAEKKAQEKEVKKQTSWNSWGNFFFGCLVSWLVTMIVIGNTQDESSKSDTSNSNIYNTASLITKIDSNGIYNLMNNYYNSINSSNYNAYNFFDHQVKQFIRVKNITADSINTIHALNNEFIGGYSKILKESVHLDSVANGNSYWQYKTDFMCYRNSMKKYETCQVPIYIELNACNKIVSYREGKPENLKFTNEKPIQ
jgi:hypothetical protein